MFLVVHNAELARRHALDKLVGVNYEAAFRGAFQGGRMVFGGVANLETYASRCAWSAPRVEREEMEVVDGEVLLVCCARFEALAYVQHVGNHILLHDIPRSAAEAQSVSLSDGVKPQAAVLAYQFARLQFEHFAGSLAEIASNVVVIIDLAEEADALRVLSLGVDEVFAFGYLPYLALLVMSDGEECLAELPVINLCKEVGLVLYGVGACDEPLASLLVLLRLGVMAMRS